MLTKHTFNPTILREYDIRGIVGETLSPTDAEAIGKGYGTVLKRRGGSKIAVGRDGRHSSPDMEAALVSGLTSVGIDVVRIGMGPSPMLYYATYNLSVDGGIMVTGSHNPGHYNGFKMLMQGASFFGEEIQKLGTLVAAGDFESGAGSVEEVDVSADYVTRLAADYTSDIALKIVWDCGNGAAGPSAEALCDKLPGEHTILYPEVDGDFPNHHPDPTEEKNLADLIAEVAKQGADLGVAFDGDGDRIGVVDGQGRILWGDQLMALYAEDVLAAQPGATIIADVKASQVLFDHVASIGGTPLMWRTGHSLIKSKMIETKSPLAGEMSGHIFFKDKYFGFDDALYAAVRLLQIVASSDKSLADMRDSLPATINTPEIRFPCDETRKFSAVDDIKSWLSTQEDADVNDVDGVRVNTADGWWLLRASNTQDVLVARCESTTEAGLERLKDQVRSALAAVDLDAPEF